MIPVAIIIQEASIPALFRTLLILVVVFAVVRLIKNINDAQRSRTRAEEAERERQRQAQNQARRTIRDDGKVRVEYRDRGPEGEYVDYEEVD